MKKIHGRRWEAQLKKGYSGSTSESGMARLSMEGFFRVDGMKNPFEPTGEEVGLVLLNGFSTVMLQAVVTHCDVYESYTEYTWASSGRFHPVIEGKQIGPECFIFMEDDHVDDPKDMIAKGLKLIQKGMESL